MSAQTTAGKIPRPPEHMMRYMLHWRAKSYVYFSLAASLASGLSYCYFFLLPRRNEYINYMKNHDGYEEMRRICSYPKKYLHSCPSVVAERLLEKGLKVDGYGESVQEQLASASEQESVDQEVANEKSLEKFMA